MSTYEPLGSSNQFDQPFSMAGTIIGIFGQSGHAFKFVCHRTSHGLATLFIQ